MKMLLGVLLLIFVSTTAYVLETIPSIEYEWANVWDGIETFVSIAFTIEYGMRLFLVRNLFYVDGKTYFTLHGFMEDENADGRWLKKLDYKPKNGICARCGYLFEPMNIVDLLAIAPFYVELYLHTL